MSGGGMVSGAVNTDDKFDGFIPTDGDVDDVSDGISDGGDVEGRKVR